MALNKNVVILLLVSVLFVPRIPSLNAADEFVEKKEKNAEAVLKKAYNPNPEEVADEVNKKVADHAQPDEYTRKKEKAAEAILKKAYNPHPEKVAKEVNKQIAEHIKKAKAAKAAAKKAYKPKPEEVTDDFNKQVADSLKRHHHNTTRRHLKEGECLATNPIDSCWRCDPKWAKNRKRLADCARGFAQGTTGGQAGEIYIVTDPSDDSPTDPTPGTLRHAVIQEVPLWIIFKNSMVITLKQELMIASNKTIDGRGVVVRIAYGGGLTIQFVQNVIIHGIRIHDIKPESGGLIRDSLAHLGLRTVSDGDAISLFGATNVWIDHVSMARCSDGLVDAIMGTTALTVSNCKFNQHNDVMLLGASDGFGEDSIMQVTVAFNRFGRGCVQRMPRCRYGFVHIVNNDYSQWEKYAIGGSAHPTIISQGNRFKAADDLALKQVTHRDYAPESEWMTWQWRSEGDLFLNGAFFEESGAPLKQSPLTNVNTIQYKPATFVGSLTRDAGSLKCKVNKPC